MPFAGKRVLALESRRAAETAELIRRQGGEPFVAPSMREVPIEENLDAFYFAERLFNGEFDMVIFLTGVGTRFLATVASTRWPLDQFTAALRRITTVARGPKPAAVLRELGIPVTIQVPEPNTWRELLAAIKDRPEHRVAVQEYGTSNPELLAGLRARGGNLSPVRVYQWDLPADTGPLREAARRLAAGAFDVVLFTTSTQVDHLFRVAREMGIAEPAAAGLRQAMIASIGPTTSEKLREHGFEPALEPAHPKLGLLVKEAAEASKKV
ncbi:MAG: uroporphyrinogen-III synthase [Acidobacteria bacterium]|nr:uroporphyrinogen-III synthase [Acidobacteriota bacterium]MBI3282429.1 uroporphyrinogen-III synthase [Acidobacteriota bacterium]